MSDEPKHTSKRLKALRTVVAKRDMEDLKGWTIPKGTTLYVMAVGPEHPTLKYRVLVVRVDNGTGVLGIMPETMVRDDGFLVKEASE